LYVNESKEKRRVGFYSSQIDSDVSGMRFAPLLKSGMQKQRLRLIRGRHARKQSRTSKKPLRNRDRLNHAPDHAETALLLIDVINDLEFEGGDVERNLQALSLMQRVLKADTTTLSSELHLRSKTKIK
jgi:hypothetical protein